MIERSLETKVSTEDLPLWMQQARQRVDWGVLLVICLSLLAARPVIMQSGFPITTDIENHIFMSSDYATAFREGRLYPRWSAAALSGYGAPIPNYAAPGAPYTVGLVEVLFTNDTILAARVVMVMAFVLAGTAVYAFVLRWAGAGPALLSSTLYLYSPYVGLTTPYILGDLPMLLGLALLPALLWGTGRLLLRNGPLDFAMLALIAAALLLTKAQFALVGAGLAAALCNWYLWNQRHWRRVGLVLLAVAVGVSLASFYWMPAILERDLVEMMAPAYQPLPLRLSFVDLIQPLRRIDPNELVVTPQITLGLPLVILTVLGSLGLLYPRGRGLYGLFLVSGLGLLLAGAIFFSLESWLLGPVTLCLSILGGAALNLGRGWQRLWLPVLLVGVLLLSLPVWAGLRWADTIEPPTLYGQILHEQQGYGVAVLPPGQSVPVTLSQVPEPSRDLIDSYQSGNAIRIPENQINIDRQASLLNSDTHRDVYLVDTRQPTRFDFLRASFAGWRASIDGMPARLNRPERGLMSVAVPIVSNADLVLRLGPTPIRARAWLISWAALGLLAIGTVRRIRNNTAPAYDPMPLLLPEEVRLLTVMLAVFAGAVFLFLSPNTPYTLQPRPGYALDNTMSLRNRTSVGLEALSYDLESELYKPGQTLDLMISWRTARPLLRNYSAQVHLRDVETGMRITETEPRYLAGFPSRRLIPNRYVRDYYRLTVPDEPGEYQIGVQLYDCDPACSMENRVNFFNTEGQPIGPVLLLPTRVLVR